MKMDSGDALAKIKALNFEQTQAQYPEFKTFLIERLQEGRRSQTKRPPMPRANDEKLQKSKATDNVKKRPPGVTEDGKEVV